MEVTSRGKACTEGPRWQQSQRMAQWENARSILYVYNIIGTQTLSKSNPKKLSNPLYVYNIIGT